MEKKTIGSFIATLRKANGLTQKQLADKLCVSDKAVSRWERDETLPDLTLIPVIAEVFGVTSDELLRGQRANPEISKQNSNAEHTEKQLRRYLTAAKTSFKIQSIISIIVAVIGFIAAMICNFAFTRANLGFLLACVFYCAATGCQIIFTTLTRSKTEAEDLDQNTNDKIKQFLHRGNQITFSIIAMMLSLSLPMIIHVSDPYWGLPIGSYALLCFVYAAACAALCALVCWSINVRLGYAVFHMKTRIRLVTIAILLPVMGITWVGHYFTTELLYANRHLLAEHTRYDSFQEFKKAIETPLDVDGSSLVLYETYYQTRIYKNSAGIEIPVDYYTVYNGTIPNTPEYSYWHANKTIADFVNDGNVFYTLSPNQADLASQRGHWICVTMFLIYPIEIAIAVTIYRRKTKKIAKE